MSSDCLFCKIIKGSIPCHKVMETEQTLAFMDVFPLSKGHVLVIPKKHSVKVHEMNPEEMADLGPVLVKVAKAVGAEDYNILQNNGKAAHQVVQHVHFHIIPKPSEEKGLGVSWPSEKADDEQLKAIAAEIRNKL
eukprot:TRINITY_DN683_c0_g1_i1.p1 TRINITY_DN683_c0_g1~~TRINITY_DN683_c0_g1_i1.p1  ORF type:complete len:135 (-),score=28.51 TRINITY_DN683_c0_g1_i1:15-419(-)